MEGSRGGAYVGLGFGGRKVDARVVASVTDHADGLGRARWGIARASTRGRLAGGLLARDDENGQHD